MLRGNGNAKQYGPDLVALAKQLGVDQRNARLMLLVEDMSKHESLPARWVSKFDATSKRWVYTHTPTGETTYLHPCIDYYRGALFMDTGGYRQLLKNMEARAPTDEEIERMNQYFGIHADEDMYIQEVGQLACVAPLPEGWVELEQPGTGFVSYKDTKTGVILDEHPLDTYFRELRDRRRRELARRRLAAIKAMQAMVGLHKRVSTAAVTKDGGAEGGAAGGAKAAEQEAEEDEEEDPRMRDLSDEWRRLQISAGKLAEMLASVQTANQPDAIACYAAEEVFPILPPAEAAAAAASVAVASAASARNNAAVTAAASARNSTAAASARNSAAVTAGASARNSAASATHATSARNSGADASAMEASAAAMTAGEALTTPRGSAAAGSRASRASVMGPYAAAGAMRRPTTPQRHSIAVPPATPPPPPRPSGDAALDAPVTSAATEPTVADSGVDATAAATATAAGEGSSTSLPAEPPSDGASAASAAPAEEPVARASPSPSVSSSGLHLPSPPRTPIGVAPRPSRVHIPGAAAAASGSESPHPPRPRTNHGPASAGSSWLGLVRQLPASWAERLRLSSWPQLLTWLPGDWVELLQAAMAPPPPPPPAPVLPPPPETAVGETQTDASPEPEAAPAEPEAPALPPWLQGLPPGLLAALEALLRGALGDGSDPSSADWLRLLLESMAAPAVLAALMGAPPDLLARLMGLPLAALEKVLALDADGVAALAHPAVEAGSLGRVMGVMASCALSPELLAKLGAYPKDLLVALLKMSPEELWALLEMAKDARTLSPSWLDDFRAFLAKRGTATPTATRGTQTPAPPPPSTPPAPPPARTSSASSTAAESVPIPPSAALPAPSPTAAAPPAPPPLARAASLAAAATSAPSPSPSAMSLSPPRRQGSLKRWAQPLPPPPTEVKSASAIAADAIASIQSMDLRPRRDFDTRPINAEFKRRTDAMRDRDLKSGPQDPYSDAPDELQYKSYRESDIKHLKQRIVRVEMQRSQMGAKLLHFSRLYQQQLTAMAVQLSDAQRQAYELRQELEAARSDQKAALQRLEAAAAAHAELALIAAMPQVPQELRTRLSVLYSTAATVAQPLTPPSGGGGVGAGGGGETSPFTTAYGTPFGTSRGGTVSSSGAGGGADSAGGRRVAAGSAAAAAGRGGGLSVSCDFPTGSPYTGGGGGTLGRSYQLPPLSQLINEMNVTTSGIGSGGGGAGAGGAAGGLSRSGSFSMAGSVASAPAVVLRTSNPGAASASAAVAAPPPPSPGRSPIQ
ncbi:hypothetical protein GPECTOR_37g238 [Gonium pectorale]|uniref:WW domain-containing protein n=1 Tax=Gonium pectorale TaxID=33097 RepID=A0A150GBL8_GONPE|nr:hypothetical protein GPECTOR_37g238 [Gonium pectorale]|eukprot:KXZ47232.1 hypothetical protein GPECTOR_37g238 [Gonium pectorale]